MSLVLDTSVVVAALDTHDPRHDACQALVTGTREALVVPMLTLPEIDYLLRREAQTDAWGRFLDDIDQGAYDLHAPTSAGLVRAGELEATYEDLGLGVVDASVIATCEDLGETKLATLDRRHFAVVRPRHCEALTLLPE